MKIIIIMAAIIVFLMWIFILWGFRAESPYNKGTQITPTITPAISLSYPQTMEDFYGNAEKIRKASESA